MDDVWDDTHDEQGELQREGHVRHERLYNAAYMNALDEGKAETVQAGFDSGFVAAVQDGRRLGQVQGSAHVLQHFASKLAHRTPVAAEQVCTSAQQRRASSSARSEAIVPRSPAHCNAQALRAAVCHCNVP